jgi:transposase
LLQDLRDQGMPVSPGTVTGGLQKLAPLFKPLVDALHQRQMSEKLFNCDETRWEVFVDMENKVGSRWYLWVNRSESVIFYKLAPNRSAAVPLAHFANLQGDKVIVICDRYSAYKKLARLSDNIILAYCWAHVRRDFLEAGISFPELEAWTLEWKERIGNLYHLNHQRLEHWDSKKPLVEQNEAFHKVQAVLAGALESIHSEGKKLAELPKFKPVARVVSTTSSGSEPAVKVSITAVNEQRKIGQSLLNHWDGLRIFFEHPEVPMDNNKAENSIRGPVNGRKNYYGSGSLWSAELAAFLFSLFQTIELWKVPIRPWLNGYLQACANNDGKPPADITPFLPWLKTKDQGVLPPDTS